MTAQLLPQGKQQYFKADGTPAVGWKVYTTDTGNNNPRTTWLDAAQVTPNANPIVLDARGEAVIFWNGAYRVRLEDNLGNTIWTVDGVAYLDPTTALLADLANFGTGTKGAGMVGFGPTVGYSANTIGSFLNSIYGRTAAEILAGVFPVNYFWPELYAARYGMVGDAITDDTLACRNMIAVAVAGGGGTCVFEHGKVYLLATRTNYNSAVPVADPVTFATQVQNTPYMVLLQNCSNIVLALNGCTIKTNVTNGGALFLLDGVRNFECQNGTLQSTTSIDGATGNILVDGTHAFACTSQTRDSYNLKFKNLLVNQCYVSVYTYGDPASAFRLRGVNVENLYHTEGSYGIATHDNGDNVVVTGMHCSKVRREYFCYGVDQSNVEMTSDTATAGVCTNIKSYDRDTKRIKFRLLTSRSSSAYNINLESQHHPATQPIPGRLIDIEVDVDNKLNAGNQVAVGIGYYQDAVLQATMAVNVFDLIKLSGYHRQVPVIDSKQNGAVAAYGRLNVDDMYLENGSAVGLFVNTGFFDNKQSYNTFTPVLKINGSAVGITFSVNTGEYWRDGRWMEVVYHMTLTNKGAGAGNVSVDLPIAAGTRFVGNPVLHGFIFANGAAIASPIVGFVPTGGATNVTLRQSAAAGSAALTDANLTNTSDILLHFRYPIW